MVKDTVLDSQDASKILRAVSIPEGFHFYKGVGEPTSVIATGLSSFTEKLKSLDLNLVDFHFKRGDFEKWISHLVGDQVLSKRISSIDRDTQGEALRQKLITTVDDRIHELTETEPTCSPQHKHEHTRARKI